MIADGFDRQRSSQTKERNGCSPYSGNRSFLKTRIRELSIGRGEMIDDPGNIRIRDRRAIDLDHLLTPATQNPGR
jgi:hypothetical protein